MNGRNPVTKFLARQREIRTELTGEETPSNEQIFNDPKKYCTEFLETLENKLENHYESFEQISIEGAQITQTEKDITDTEARLSAVMT